MNIGISNLGCDASWMLLRPGRDVDGGYGTAIMSAILAVTGLAVNLAL